LGVAVLDTGSGRHIAHRDRERFFMNSTCKLLLVAAVLARIDQGKEKPDRRIVYGKNVLLEWAPVTSLNVGPPGMTVAELCEAAITLSDNTAANLLLNAVGGPAAVTAYARSLKDPVTRLDRHEPANNVPDGELDTTMPSAMLSDMRKLLLDDALSKASRRQLRHWLLGCQTGAQTLRAGLSAHWRIGDKTGSGKHTNNDIAIVWPPRRKPLLVTAYYTNPTADTAARKAVLADIGRIITEI
jgi:beta-lactamase class A